MEDTAPTKQKFVDLLYLEEKKERKKRIAKSTLHYRQTLTGIPIIHKMKSRKMI